MSLPLSAKVDPLVTLISCLFPYFNIYFQTLFVWPLVLRPYEAFENWRKKMLFETYQWIGFYMITASVLKGLTNNFYGFSLRFPRHWSLKIDSLNWLVNLLTKTGHRRCSIKKGALKNFENSQENTCARVSFLIKLQASEMQLY